MTQLVTINPLALFALVVAAFVLGWTVCRFVNDVEGLKNQERRLAGILLLLRTQITRVNKVPLETIPYYTFWNDIVMEAQPYEDDNYDPSLD